MAHTNVQFVKVALKQVGKPYVWGGSNPSTGFDCSGLVSYSLGQLGIPFPHYSVTQYQSTRRVAPGQLKPGDLVFLNFPGETSPGHVMIWLGLDTVLQAPSAGQKVQLSHFNPQKPGTNEWGAQVVGYGRIKQLSYSGSPASVITPAQASAVAKGHGPTAPVGTGSSGGGGGGIWGDITSTAGTVAGDVNSVARHVPGVAQVEGAFGAVSSIGDAISFLWKNPSRVFMTVGGGIVLLMGVYLLVSKVGLSIAENAPIPIKSGAKKVTAAASTATGGETRALTRAHNTGQREGRIQAARREGRTAGRASIAQEKPIPRRTRRVALAGDTRPKRPASTYDPATSEIPF